MVAGHEQSFGRGHVEQTKSSGDGLLAIHVEHSLPGRMPHK
jgi:hypothetical protein